VETALARVRPAALVLVETELWPCWIAAAFRRRIPVVLVSGRVSDRSYPRYRRLAWIIRPLLA
jgi:3-deoxy-D-manno-octulosonic-acid transferase